MEVDSIWVWDHFSPLYADTDGAQHVIVAVGTPFDLEPVEHLLAEVRGGA